MTQKPLGEEQSDSLHLDRTRSTRNEDEIVILLVRQSINLTRRLRIPLYQSLVETSEISPVDLK